MGWMKYQSPHHDKTKKIFFEHFVTGWIFPESCLFWPACLLRKTFLPGKIGRQKLIIDYK
ncbi:MAG: hypothetical protein EGQ81_00745 [Akkermansia sp.]|nr:hypothetical protein [Akkermansia sp.]